MNYFSQRRLMVLAIVVLLILNLATLGTFWFFKSGKSQESFRKNRPHKVEKFLINKLDFDSRQSQELGRLMEEHRAGAIEILKSMQTYREELYDAISSEDSLQVEQITGRIAAAQATLDKATYYHFRSIRQICTPEQRQKFDSVIKEVIRHHHPGRRRLKKQGNSSK